MQTQTKQEQEQEIIELTNEITKLMIAKDIEGLDQLLDDDFTLTHITGYVQSKQEWLGEIRSESMKYFDYEAVNRSVKIKGSTATITQQNILDARIWGSRNKWRLQQILNA